MESKQLTITIEGPQGAGKSRIAEGLESLLMAAEKTVHVREEDNPHLVVLNPRNIPDYVIIVKQPRKTTTVVIQPRDFDKILHAIEDAESFFSNFSENPADDRRRQRMAKAKDLLMKAWGPRNYP